MSIQSITRGLTKMVAKLEKLKQHNEERIKVNDHQVTTLFQINADLSKENIKATKIIDNLNKILGE